MKIIGTDKNGDMKTSDGRGWRWLPETTSDDTPRREVRLRVGNRLVEPANAAE